MLPIPVRSISLLGICAALLPAAQPGAYAGSIRCAACHPEEFRRQSASAHAGALYQAAQHPLASRFVTNGVLRRPPAYDFQFSRTSEGMAVLVADARTYLKIPLPWAFGAGRQAVTFLCRIDRIWYLELYFSYYPALAGMGVTPGHLGRTARTLAEAAGLVYKSLDPASGVVACFDKPGRIGSY